MWFWAENDLHESCFEWISIHIQAPNALHESPATIQGLSRYGFRHSEETLSSSLIGRIHTQNDPCYY